MKQLPSPGFLRRAASRYARRSQAIRAVIEPLEQRVLLSAAPTGLVATAISNSTVNLSWTINKGSGVLVDFEIERSLSSTSGFTIINAVAPTTSTFQDTGLTPGTTYFYEVFGQVYSDTLQTTAPSNVVTAATTNVAAPAAPSNLVATAVTDSEIDLTWINHASNPSGFVLERATSANFTNNLITLGSATASFNNTSLAANTTYFYRVAATVGGNNSAFSPASSATTQAVPSAHGTLLGASNLIVTRTTPTAVTLSWNINSDLGGPLLIFELQRSFDGTTGWTTIGTASASAATGQDTTVAASTTYFYRVLGVFLMNNQTQAGTPSNVVLTTT